MKNLIEQLTANTQDLKNEYLEKVESWSAGYYDLMIVRSKWSEAQWCEFLGIQPRLVNVGTNSEFLSFPKNFYSTPESKTYSKLRDESSSLNWIEKDVYVQKSLKNAITHYENSILKLADRIVKKGIDLNNFVITSGRVGVNIEVMIKDDKNTVKAWTVVASGPVQRPHYRYLIK